MHHQWNANGLENFTRLSTLIPDIGTHPPGIVLPRAASVRLNRLLTGVGRFKLGMTPSAPCECGAEEQTDDQVVLHSPIHPPPYGAQGLRILDYQTTKQSNSS